MIAVEHAYELVLVDFAAGQNGHGDAATAFKRAGRDIKIGAEAQRHQPARQRVRCIGKAHTHVRSTKGMAIAGDVVSEYQ